MLAEATGCARDSGLASFIKAMLVAEPQLRPSMSDMLLHPYLHQAVTAAEHPSGDPQSAAAPGLFSAIPATSSSDDLAQEQTRQAGSEPLPAASAATPPSAVTNGETPEVGS